MNWSTSNAASAKENTSDSVDVRLLTVLRYKNKEVMRKTGIMGRDSLVKLRDEYNAKNYEPKMGRVCIADLPPHERPAAIKKMSDGIQEGFPNMILDPLSNAEAKRRFKQP